MKVRVGLGIGTSVMTGDEIGALVGDLQSLGFDSLWWSDVLTVAGDDPLVAMAYAAGAAPRLKIGTTMVLPGRNPVRLAKQLATLDRMSGGRLLVTFVLGLPLPGELAALGVEGPGRGAQVDELLPLLRRLWTGDAVTHRGPRWTLSEVTVLPRPMQDPLDVWLGGSAPSALARVGRLADGWLPALCTPEEAAAGRAVIEEVATGAGRRIDPEHFGVSIGYAGTDAPPDLLRRVAVRRRARGSEPSPGELVDLVPRGHGELRRLLGRFVEVGFSKFVLRPVVPPASWRRELEELAGAVLDLQT